MIRADERKTPQDPILKGNLKGNSGSTYGQLKGNLRAA